MCVCACQFTWLNFYAICFSGTWLPVNIICLPFCQWTHTHTRPCRLSILIVVYVTNNFQDARFHQLKFWMSIKLIRFSSRLYWLCSHAHAQAHAKPNNLKLRAKFSETDLNLIENEVSHLVVYACVRWDAILCFVPKRSDIVYSNEKCQECDAIKHVCSRNTGFWR